jgi:hypothetical protein
MNFRAICSQLMRRLPAVTIPPLFPAMVMQGSGSAELGPSVPQKHRTRLDTTVTFHHKDRVGYHSSDLLTKLASV